MDNNDISKQLDIIIELLRKQEVTLEKYYQDYEYARYIFKKNVFDISSDDLFQCNPIFLLGYRQKDILDFFRSAIPEIECISLHNLSMGDFAAIVTNKNEGDILLLDGTDANWNEFAHILSGAMISNVLETRVGAGSASRLIKIDIPKLKYIVFNKTDLYMPNYLRDAFECCFSNINTENQ